MQKKRTNWPETKKFSVLRKKVSQTCTNFAHWQENDKPTGFWKPRKTWDYGQEEPGYGTAAASVDSIMRQGILKGKRLYVHLSETVETATNVGKRHGTPVILRIDAKRMHEDGIPFFLSRNGVWLTDHVDVKYISET